MTAMHPGSDRELLLDLLVERTSGAISDSESERLDRLLAESNDELHEDYFDHAAAALSVAFGSSLAAGESMPDELRARCASAFQAEAVAPISTELPDVETLPPRPIRFTPEAASARSTSSSRGWLVAASLGLIAAAGWWQAYGGGSAGIPEAASALAQRDALVDRGVASLAWSPWGEQATEELAGVDGSVVWDQASQEGYMTFRGLPANDPATMRYQLWIVDTSRGEPLAVPPVDGGVFDVPAGGGEVVVPIRAKLAVGNAAVFAVTREGPQGAVVSERRPEQLVVIASAG